MHFEDLSYGDPGTLADLPWVLVQNEEHERLEEVLCDLKFIQAKCQAGMLTGLLADYQLALERWPDYTFYDPFMPPGARPGRPSAAKPFKVSSEESEVGVAETLGSVVDLLLALPDDRREIQAGKPVCNSENPIPDRHFGQDLGISERLKQIHHLQKASSEGRDLHLKEVGPERVHAFANFVYACREDLTRHPSQTAMLARNRGMGCPVARQGESLTNGLTGCWISRDPRPRSPALYPACARVLEEHTAAVNCTAASPDGTRALSGSSDMVLRLWDLASGMSLLRLEEHEGSISSVALTSQAQFAVSAGADNTIRVWNLESGKCFKTLKEPSQQLLGLAASADGKRVVSFAGDHCLKIWDVEAGQVLHTIGVLESPATAVAMTADGKMALSAGQNGRVHAWAADSGKLLLTLRKHERPIRSVAVTPDGKLGIAGCQDGTLSVWDMARGNLLQMLEGHPAPVASVAASPDGRIVLSGSADGTIRVWDVASGQTVQVLHGHTDVVNCVSVTPDARLAVSAGGDDALRVWDLAEGQAFELPTDRWSGAPSAVSPDQKSVVSPAEDNSLRFWDTSTGQTIRRLEGHKEPVRSVIFTPDGSTAVSAGKDFTVRIWDLVAGQSHLTLEGHTESVNSLGVTPDCKLVVSASSDSTLRTWELKTGKAMKVFEGHHGSIHCVALTPDGKTAVSASDDNTLKVWDLADGKLLRSLEGHTFPVRGVSVTPDGKTAVSASWDRTVCAWDIQSGRRLALYLPQALMEAVSEIKPDGTFAVGSMDGHMHFLKLQNLKQEAPIVTGAFRLEFDTKGLGKQMASVFKRVLHTESPQDRQTPAFGPGQKMGGHYAKVPTFTCPWCGEQSPVPDEPRKIIQGNIRDVENMRKFVAAPSPCLFLPKETFDEPKLAILCPACRKSLRLNPFFADTRS
jgi:WD40 repeat protein